MDAWAQPIIWIINTIDPYSLLKVIKIGSTVFFKTQQNRKEYLGEVC